MNNSYVYALFRPDNGDVFYIGATSSKKRIKQHLASRRGEKAKVIQGFLAIGYKEIPFVVIRDELTVWEAAELETFLINTIGRYPDGPLLNVRLFSGVADENVRQVMSAKAKARDRSGEWETNRRARMGDADVREKMSESAKARIRTPEFEAKRLAAATSPEAKAKRREKMNNRGWITDGINDQHFNFDNPIPDGWYRGRSSPKLSQEELDRRANDIQENREIWLERNRSMIWITNGNTAKRVLPDEPIAEGWQRGREIKLRRAIL